MMILAIETSSARGGLALVSDGAVLAEEMWSETEVRGQHLFRVLPGLLARAGADIGAVEVFAAGRGPGSYSGLRVGLTAAQALALPGRQRVFTVSSGSALALEMAERHAARTVAVLGDARRNTVWLGVFEARDGDVAVSRPWTVVEPGVLANHLPPDALLVTPDWERLAGVRSALGSVRWVEGAWYPKASYVGRLAHARMLRGDPSEPVTPIYMHPAVAEKR